MAAPLLAQYLGGGADSMLGNLMLAFVAAVAFATIVAVVAGLVLAAASAMSHDIWVAYRQGRPRHPKGAGRSGAHLLADRRHPGHLRRHRRRGPERAILVALAFAVAASSNLPAVFLTLYWKRANTYGIVLGMMVGTVAAVGRMLVSPNMTYPLTETANAEKVIAAAPGTHAALQSAVDAAANWPRSKHRRRSKKPTPMSPLHLGEFRQVCGPALASLVGLEKPLTPVEESGLLFDPDRILGHSGRAILAPRQTKTEEM